MYFRLLRRALVVFLTIMTSSCSNLVQNSHVAIDYQPPKVVAKLRAPSKAPVQVGVINDFRGVGDKKLVMPKVFGDGMDGKYLATEDLTHLIEKATRETLKRQNYQVVNNNAHYILTGNLLKMDLHWRDALAENTLLDKTQIEFTLTNIETGIPIWRQVFVANLGRKSYAGIGASSAIAHVVSRGLQDILYQLESSASFRNAIASK